MPPTRPVNRKRFSPASPRRVKLAVNASRPCGHRLGTWRSESLHPRAGRPTADLTRRTVNLTVAGELREYVTVAPLRRRDCPRRA